MDRKRLCRFLIYATCPLLLTGLSMGQSDCQANGCCSNGGYKEIDEPRRSISSVLEAGDVTICDRTLATGWYRFTSYVGDRMPTAKVAEFRCGTVHPIWMKGAHPRIEDGTVDRKACINFYDANDGCFTELNIKVRNCSGFYVYYLGPTFSCSLAYCAGYKEPCPYGETGQPPHCTELPKEFNAAYLAEPTIEFKQEETPEQIALDPVAVSLVCKVQLAHGIGQWNNVTYRIEWFSEGRRLQDPTLLCQVPPNRRKNDAACPNSDTLVSVLAPGDKYKAEMWITCNVSAKFTNSLLNKWSTPKQVRQPFYAGIKVYPATLRLSACQPLDGNTITIEPTIPVRIHPDQRRRNRLIKVTIGKPVGIEVEPCTFELQGTNSVQVKIVPVCPFPDNGQTRLVIVVELNGGNGLFWLNSLRSVSVSVLTSEVQRCKSYTDPHYYAMDSINVYRGFDFFGHGDFLLYRNTEKNFEVQTRQWACNRAGITCNCAAVLRDHNDVIEFSCCNKDLFHVAVTEPTPLQIKIRSKKCLRPGISIESSIQGSNIKYVILFPTGVKVELLRNYWGIDVTILTTRASQALSESGICLFNGGDVHAFGLTNRLNPGHSYFDILPQRIDDTTANYASVCSCIHDNEPTMPGQQCPLTNPFNVPTFLETKMTALNLCDRREVRDIHYSDDLTDEDFELFKIPLLSEHHHQFKRALPDPVVSKENASLYCTQKIADSKIGKLCDKVGVNVQAYVNSCAVDIALTGEFSFAVGVIAMLTDDCGYLAAANVSSNKNESSEQYGNVSVVANEISNLLCPNECSFNGECVNASCVCNKDFTAEDCSISVFQKPRISKLQSDGLCDKRIRACKKVTVLGSGWLNSTNITCHLQEFKVVNSSWTPNNETLRFPGIMTDLVMVDCLLPDSPVMEGHFDENKEGTPAAGLVISASNDGIHKSDASLTFISYDSACMACNVTSGCYLKSNSCFINQYCFAPNEVNPKDWCLECLPDVSKNSWSDRRVNHPPNITYKTEYYALQQEFLELAFEATDPENMPVSFSLMDGSPLNAVMKGNVLQWNVTTVTTTAFFLKATDACLASSTFNFTVSIVQCQCKNNGTCLTVSPRGSGYYLCSCPAGFTGATCETNIDECQTYPCVQGRCVDGVNNYTCVCSPGFEGRNCDKDKNDCQPSPCTHGSCNDHVNGYTCTCDPGYTGVNCSQDIDECQSSPCFHGRCFDRVNSYNCQCDNGYTGADCNVEINECLSSPCINGTCEDKIGSFACHCHAGFSGIRCEEDINECLPVSCGNGRCIDQLNNYSCVCNAGYTGRHCDVVIVHCASDTCYPNVTCTEISNTISCGSCPSGFTGDGKNCEDINDCVNHTCSNGASCVDGINNYSCSCVIGYTGIYCETDIDDCVNRTCVNGGLCVDGVNSYSCNCSVGFTGDRCETDIDDCVNHTCINGGSCVDGLNNHTCNCSVGYTGDYCQTDIEDCVNQTCANGGACVDGINSYSCNCSVGFTGNHCETDIDDCVNHTCINGGSCVDGVNSYSCNCSVGYTGDYCQTDIDDCVNHTCVNDGSCVDGVDSYSCNCSAGFAGNNCETDIDDCVNHICINGGSCVDRINSYSCNCSVGYTGDYCQTDIDDCVNHTCINGGSCVDGVNSYSCNCSVGYTGDYCQTVISSSSKVPSSTAIQSQTTLTTRTPLSSTDPLSSTTSDDATTFPTQHQKESIISANSYAIRVTQSYSFPKSVSTQESQMATHIPETDVFPRTSSHLATTLSSKQQSVLSTISRPSPSVFFSTHITLTKPTTEGGETDVFPQTSSHVPTTLSSKQQSVLSSISRPSPSVFSSTHIPSTKPTTEGGESEFAFKIKILEDWNDDLEDKNSDAFKSLSSRLETELWKMLSGRGDLIAVKVASFSKGSIVAEFQLTFKKKTAAEGALEGFRQEISDGNLGNLRVDPESLEQIPRDTQEPADESKPQKIPYVIIIGATLGGLFALALICICLMSFCKKNKTMRRKRRGSGVMPSEEAFPDREKYELKNAKSMDNIVYFEEVGLWGKPMKGEKNEAFN